MELHPSLRTRVQTLTPCAKHVGFYIIVHVRGESYSYALLQFYVICFQKVITQVNNIFHTHCFSTVLSSLLE